MGYVLLLKVQIFIQINITVTISFSTVLCYICNILTMPVKYLSEPSQIIVWTQSNICVGSDKTITLSSFYYQPIIIKG